jgi:hypothetical protein
LTSLSRSGPGPRTLAASTTIGLTMKDPLVRQRVVRMCVVISERKLVAEYWTWNPQSMTGAAAADPNAQNDAMVDEAL